MKNTLTTHAKQVYRRCTASTKRWALYAVPASMALFLYGTMFFGAIAIGANVAVTGGSVEEILTTVNASRFEIWMEFADEGALSKSLFGLVYPIIASVYAVTVAGIQLGHAVPQLGYVVEGVSLFWPVIAFGLIVLQFIRFADLYTNDSK